ncbi:MAG: exodeoxyribonuclease VII large subunit [Spirochaetales bacterium]|nr:exodeoxyribonuclease VII large subunit [Spirochaetales bacterium]
MKLNIPTEKCFSVTEITSIIQSMLEDSFPVITVEGEISNFRPSSTGHLYFSLKDKDALLSAVMFKNRSLSLRLTPKDGMLVKVRGSISVYAKRGSYQIICEEMTLAGEGDILAMLEERKRRLAAEGLFDSDRKKKLPLLPGRIAVITSPTGAALRDILNVLGRRHAGLHVVILPAAVQGEEAAAQIVRQIRTANEFDMGDVIIIGRGGGSLEDLLAFSDEEVVRAIAESRIPVISAVGHETDTSLSDLAADLRAPTPSAAAEMVTASREDLSRRVAELAETLSWSLSQKLSNLRQRLEYRTCQHFEREYRGFLQPLLLRVDDAKELMLYSMKDALLKTRHRFALLVNTIEASSPKQILKRGFAVVTDTDCGKILTGTKQTKPGHSLSISLYEGTIIAEVKETDDHAGI